jgi:hypothetical protein
MNETEFVMTMKALPGRYADRMSAEDLEGLQLMAQGGEWGEEIDLLVASLAGTQQPISDQERQVLRQLLERMDLPTDRLNEVPAARR